MRKTLGQHEIATVQTTAIDQTAGIVNLTTVLAHSSGEWIASDWPVCAVSETATPHRMGAALTYARRYALFTLVGIAGEDDIDAPDLKAPMPPASAAAKPAPNKHGRLNGGQSHSGLASRHKVVSNPAKPILGAEASATLRDQLVGELKAIASSDEAAIWAHRILDAKNSLTAADARQVEDAFRAKLEALESAADISDQPFSHVASALQPSSSSLERQPVWPAPAIAEGIDKSRLAHPEPRRFRDKEHVKFVAKQACLICGRKPADAHHLRFAQHRALGRKVSDEFTVPLCRGHHREAHRCGDEAAWWKNAGVDPTITARATVVGDASAASNFGNNGRHGSPAALGTDQKNGKGDPPVSKLAPNSTTKAYLGSINPGDGRCIDFVYPTGYLTVIEVRQTEIFARWLANLRDGRARARINARIRRLSVGNPGDTKSVGGGVSEMRIDYGPGYRVYFVRRGEALVILVAGGDKRTQNHDIAMAIKLARDL